MHRLPGYDAETRRSESAMFGIIGAAGLAVIAAAVSPALKFAAQRDAIVAGLTGPAEVQAPAQARHAAMVSVTNLSAHQRGLPAVFLPPAQPAASPQS